MSILIHTIQQRWYVVLFLIAYLGIASRLLGLRFTILFLTAGYFIAFLSEFSAINNGFPYGWYHYIYENLKGEWLFCGVPVWDSVSYVFMNFAGLCAAQYSARTQNRLKFTLLAASLTVLLDVVTDPLAHRGEQWFLGKIYYYPNPGFYFDVTLSNFAGWFLVSTLICGFAIFALNFQEKISRNTSSLWLGIGLYYGILAFTFSLTLWIQAWLLALCSLFWVGVTIAIVRPHQIQK